MVSLLRVAFNMVAAHGRSRLTRGNAGIETSSADREPIMATASGDRLTYITAEAVHAEMERLIPRFTRQHGIAVDVKYDVNPAVTKRVMNGEDFDVGLTNPWYVEEMI